MIRSKVRAKWEMPGTRDGQVLKIKDLMAIEFFNEEVATE